MNLPDALNALNSSIVAFNSSLAGIQAFSDSLEPFLFGLAGCICAGVLVYALLSG